jgi:hypothetical protein
MNPTHENFMLGALSPDKNKIMLAPQSTVPAQDFVLMDFGDFQLLIPSSEVVSLVSAQYMVAQPQSSFDCGYVEFMQHYYAIFCLNKNLQLEASISARHSTIVLLNEQDFLLGVCCYELTKLPAPTGPFYVVPLSMRSRKQPFVEFTIINNHAVGLSSAAALCALLRLRGATLLSQQNTTPIMQGAV